MLIAYGLLLIAVGMDVKNMRISNRLILIGLGISFVRRLLCEGIVGVFTGIFLISFPVILLYLLFLAGALGAGDIKLFSLIGGFVNFKELVWCIIFAFVFAAVFSLLKMLYHGIFLSSMRNVWNYLSYLCAGVTRSYVPLDQKKNKIHFSVAIFLGFIVSTNFMN